MKKENLNSTKSLFNSIDYYTFFEQRMVLNRVIAYLTDDKEVEVLEGLKQFLYLIIDVAMTDFGIPSDVVYPKIGGIIYRRKMYNFSSPKDIEALKAYLKENKFVGEQNILANIQELFPKEYGEYLDGK